MPDVTPALYFGFDQPLPNDLISLYLGLELVRDPETMEPDAARLADVIGALSWRPASIAHGATGPPPV